jgi:hypothetical protein
MGRRIYVHGFDLRVFLTQAARARTDALAEITRGLVALLRNDDPVVGA